MIRPATVEDLYNKDLHRLGASFFAESGLPGTFTSAVFIHNWTFLIENNKGVILLLIQDTAIVGALGAIIHPDINDGKVVAQEMFWFIGIESRGNIDAVRLFSAFEQWAVDNKASRICTACVCNEKMSKVRAFYERKGLVPKEVNFFKDL